MGGRLQRVRDLVRLFFTGRGAQVWRAVTRRLYSNGASIGLKRDVTVPFTAPAAKLPIRVRALAPADDLSFLDVHQAGLSDDQVFGRLGQRRILESGLQTCHVALGPDGRPCYMQWLIPSAENDRLRAFFGNLYPRLGPDEALLEGAYTPEEHRGKGIMASAMAQIAERGRELGARRVITFVDEGNVASLKGCERAGFTPYLRRHEAFRLFRRRITFTPLIPAPARQVVATSAA
jgi:GNAT superfamily N-acetyltransferase